MPAKEDEDLGGLEELEKALGPAKKTPTFTPNRRSAAPPAIESRGRLLGMVSVGLAIPALAGMVISYLQQVTLAFDPRGETVMVWIVFGVVVAISVISGIAGVLAMSTTEGRRAGLLGAVMTIPTLILFLIFSNQLWTALANL